MHLRDRQRGLTLLELMITVAILAIVSSLAYVTYDAQSRKGRRAEAIVALEQVAQAQQRFFTARNTFTTDIGELKGYGIESGTTPGGYYIIELTEGDGGIAQAFVATAKPVGGQTKDTCEWLSVASNGTRDGAPDRKTCWGN